VKLLPSLGFGHAAMGFSCSSEFVNRVAGSVPHASSPCFAVAAFVGVLVATAGCEPSFAPPDLPEHNVLQGDVKHAFSNKYPYLCRSAGSRPTLVPCPSNQPPDEQLSCDTYGCHGAYVYDGTSERYLLGSEGPSCHTCHDKLWDEAGRDPDAPLDLNRINREAAGD